MSERTHVDFDLYNKFLREKCCISWAAASKEVKRHFPSPPQWEDFENENEFSQAQESWNHMYGRNFSFAVQREQWRKFLDEHKPPEPW